MPKGPKASVPADVIGNALRVMRIATGAMTLVLLRDQTQQRQPVPYTASPRDNESGCRRPMMGQQNYARRARSPLALLADATHIPNRDKERAET